MLAPRRNFKAGFTLIELLVTLSIFVILTGVVLFNQAKFNSSILLTNLAYDTALTIRQAQTYGINIKEFGDSKFVPYGVHFDLDSPKSFILYADVNYKGGGLTVYQGLASTCDTSKGCVSRYNIKGNNYISSICTTAILSGNRKCFTSNNSTLEKQFDILFQRPNPDARIYQAGDMITDNFSAVDIILSSQDGKSTSTVKVQSNGLIQVGN